MWREWNNGGREVEYSEMKAEEENANEGDRKDKLIRSNSNHFLQLSFGYNIDVPARRKYIYKKNHYILYLLKSLKSLIWDLITLFRRRYFR